MKNLTAELLAPKLSQGYVKSALKTAGFTPDPACTANWMVRQGPSSEAWMRAEANADGSIDIWTFDGQLCSGHAGATGPMVAIILDSLQ